MYVQLVNGDLLAQDVDAIVNPWNRNWFPWWMVWMHQDSAAILAGSGEEPFRELSRCRRLKTGDAVSTSAGKLSQKRIIHVASGGWLTGPVEPAIGMCIRAALEIARAEQLQSLAFPVLGSGVSGLPRQEALDVMFREFQDLDYGISVSIVVQELLAPQA